LLLTQRVGLHVAAHQHQVRAQLLHQVELALGAVEVLLQAVAAAAFEITKRLEQGDGDAQVGAPLAHFARAAGVVQQVVLEDLDAVEPAAAMASSFSGRVPLKDTVAIERCMGEFLVIGKATRQTLETALAGSIIGG